MDFVANFNLNKNKIEADFELNQPAQFDALLELNPVGANWGGITGNLSDQTDLQNALDLKADKIELEKKTSTYIHEQGEASDTWVINHKLNKKPSITIVDSADNVVEGAEKYIDNDTIEIYFNGAFKGKAYLN